MYLPDSTGRWIRVAVISVFSTVGLPINLLTLFLVSIIMTTLCFVGTFFLNRHFFFTILEKFNDLLEANQENDLHILRIYSRAVETKDFPDPNYGKKFDSDATCPDWAKPYALHHMIRKKSGGVYDELNTLEEQIKLMNSSGKTSSGSQCIKYRKLLNEASKSFLLEEKFDVIFCTCNEASGRRVKMLSPRQCIIDECGMAHEPETIVPISLCEHAVLIGDHMQLQPVIDYRPAKECGLATSLFERYAMKCGDKFILTLEIQYRMVSVLS